MQSPRALCAGPARCLYCSHLLPAVLPLKISFLPREVEAALLSLAAHFGLGLSSRRVVKCSHLAGWQRGPAQLGGSSFITSQQLPPAGPVSSGLCRTSAKASREPFQCSQSPPRTEIPSNTEIPPASEEGREGDVHNPNLLSDNTLFQDTYYPLERQESIHPGGLLFSPTSLSSSFIFSQSHKISSQIWRECSCATKASRWLDIGLGQNLWPAGTGKGCPQVKTPFSSRCPLEQETKTMWTYLCWAGV